MKPYKIINGIFATSHRYKSDMGEISLVGPSRITMDSYEIYCIEGDLFDDVERFATLEDAEKRISELLKIQ